MENCNPMEQKSLMNSLAKLESRAETLRDISDLSKRLLIKFQDPRRPPQGPHEGDNMNKQCITNAPALDLIDLFNNTSERIQNEIDTIGNNLEKLLSMVE